MATLTDFSLFLIEDGTLSVSLVPPTPLGGFGIQFVMTKRLGGSTIILKSMNSGYSNGESGVSMVNSGTGVFNVSLYASECSGLDAGAYSYTVNRTTSGKATALTEGYRICPR